MLAILLPTDRDTHPLTHTHKHTLSVWPFPSTTLVADSNVPWADKLYQPTHLSLHIITHMHTDPRRHVSFLPLLTRQTPATAVCACACVCVR